ncbi:NAD(P)-dependent oxidoreductase [Streptomyces boncukensis]|uniref:D-2-hydroxyacid dehydrogenase n=1 Tax=Streptomyces boncukensis TaxID=2711219 RepID=A0A6G4X8P3_9ACTN|nr:NAD(P)-dependent oxidoreductase [Streptomyces boncukensis]NGO73919.1 D-2-hydroxyacid dehydrogenase [Streptomyces boncukensis]
MTRGADGVDIEALRSALADGARVVADPALSDALVHEIAAVAGRPVHREPDDGPAPLVHVGPALPESLRRGRHAGRLLWTHSTNAGVDALLAAGPAPWPERVLLTRTVGRMGERIAQYVLGWVLADCQDVPGFLVQHRDRVWHRRPGELAAGQRALVFGTGRIGSAVAAALQRVGVHTTGVARTPRATPGCDRVLSLDEARGALAGARWVVNALPLTPHTAGLFDTALFTALRGAAFVNVGRGESVDLRALDAALRAGHVRSAVLDVLPDEPAGPDSPVWDLPRTVVTAHSAGVTADADVAVDFGACWREVAGGHHPELAIGPGAGY